MASKREKLRTAGTILYEILTKTYVDKQTVINVITDTQSTGYYHIGRLKKEGYIEERTIVLKDRDYDNKSSKSVRRYDYLCITAKGYKYFDDSYEQLIPWWDSEIEEGVLKLRSDMLKGAERIKNYLSTTTVAIMADLIGAEETIPETPNGEDAIDYTSDDYDNIYESISDTRRVILNDFLRASLNKYKKAKKSPSDLSSADSDQIIFYDMTYLRRKIREANIKDERKNLDASFARFSGILSSSHRTAMCYVINEKGDLSWGGLSSERDIKTSKNFETSFNLLPSRNKKECICFLPSPEAFSRMVNASVGRDRRSSTKREQENINYENDLSHMFIIPVTREGVYALRYLMITSVESDQSHIISSLVESGEYYENTDKQVPVDPFAIIDDDDRYVVVYPFLDLISIKRAFRIIARCQDKRFVIQCRRWMIPYLKALFLTEYNNMKDRVEIAEIYNMFDSSVNELPIIERPHIPLAVERDLEMERKEIRKNYPDPSSFPLKTCPPTCPFLSRYMPEQNTTCPYEPALNQDKTF